MTPDSPCAPGAIVSERVVIMEQELRMVSESLRRFETAIHGRLDSMADDLRMSLAEMKAQFTRLDIIVRGERGDNGLTSLVSDLIRREERRSVREKLLVGALVSAIAVQLVATFWPDS